VTAPPHADVRFLRAIERRASLLAEDAACELPNLPLEGLLQLVRPHAERGAPETSSPPRVSLRFRRTELTRAQPNHRRRPIERDQDPLGHRQPDEPRGLRPL
jgi:hypothetical protein